MTLSFQIVPKGENRCSVIREATVEANIEANHLIQVSNRGKRTAKLFVKAKNILSSFEVYILSVPTESNV